MKPTFYRFVFFLLLLCVLSCKKNKSSEYDNYRYFSHSNIDWKSKKAIYNIGDINYSVTEVPLQYYILRSGVENLELADSIYKLNSKERVLEMEFEHMDQKDLLQQDYTNKSYEDAVKYMSFFIEKDFKIITSSNDTIPCSGVNFERNFKVAPFKRILLYFNNINPNDGISLIYNDSLFGNGSIKFKLNEAPLKL